MRLRASGEHTGDDYNLHAVMQGEMDGSGVPHGELLNAFAEGVCNRDRAQTDAARREILATLGEAALVDAAAVIAAFNAYPRAADATGIPIETWRDDSTAAFRAELGIDAFDSRNMA